MKEKHLSLLLRQGGDEYRAVWFGAATQTLSFPSYGSYVIRAKAYDDHGVTTTQSITVVVANSAPVATISASPSAATTGQTVTFDASGSHDAEGPIAGYRWDLDGDGSFETSTGATPTASAAFPNPGHIDVSVQVTDADGATGVAVAGVQVSTPGSTPPSGSGGSTGSGSTTTPSTPGTTAPLGGTTPSPLPGTTTGSTPSGGTSTTAAFSAGLSGAALQSLKLVLRKGVKLSCAVNRAANCTVSLTISATDGRRLKLRAANGARTITIGSATRSASAAGSAPLVVRIKSSVASRLRRATKIVVRATGTARSAEGATIKLARGVILRG